VSGSVHELFHAHKEKNAVMSDNELDIVYTKFCKAMSEVGEPDAPLFLARFALLAMVRIGNADAVLELIAQAKDAEDFQRS
jgi:hypothetical protein